MPPPSKPLSIAFVHPDLGIGGAERLAVDAAVAMKMKGHHVIMYTSHHDPNHCFEETRDGTLDVEVHGDFLPRTLFGRFYIVFAILRQLYLTLIMITTHRSTYDVIFIDQLSACIPLFQWLTPSRVLFYCHFPDKLLATRDSALKKLYRAPADALEELTTGQADTIVVNSCFTAGMFKKSFPTIAKTPEVLYPPINFEAYDRPVDMTDSAVQILDSKTTFLSINRFERKKNIELALRAFAAVKEKVSPETFNTCRLVLAGGYDRRVQENVEYLETLDGLAHDFGLTTFTIQPGACDTPPKDAQVVFLCSFSDTQRTFLLRQAKVILYTPSNEHFGIVPVEGMYASVPVMAVNNGGPTESIEHGKTGWLLTPDPAVWGEQLAVLLADNVDVAEMGQHGRRRVQTLFSLDAFGDHLDQILRDLVASPRVSTSWYPLLLTSGLIAVLAYFFWFQANLTLQSFNQGGL
ncbi:alpha-1,3/1,6-mannosyltransferase ALG2 [Syncephalastrum racemosum]|uniref:Alpha-1,3/1,6-mannosyltransferase ALG2 n=1 Tax=Syncephalastrum racemosum TaxID=13706 RepID=A0A1X2HH00_SYNRA|nr:alpha-1,3/1,6-mannosyltransferase ALG2 [Syncephalastrum racemosum]